MSASPLALAAVLAALPAAASEKFRVDPEVGNNTFTAVFDAALGERITAQTSSVSCDLVWDEKAGTASGTCSVPLTAIMVDNEPTKTDHFRQWATNKKSEPGTCRLEATFQSVKVGALPPGKPAPFVAEIPFTVCGRARSDGAREKVTGAAVLLPAGTYGDKKTIRIRAAIEKFDREAYRIGPAFTDGWLARVQSLAKVVAREGRVDLNVFAVAP